MTVEKPNRIIEESVVAKRTPSRAPSLHWLFLPDRGTLLDARQSFCEEVQNSRSETLLDSHSAQIASGSRANRNVWSAATPQAKCEDVTSWSAQMYTAFVGVNHSWPGWNALRSFPR